MGSTERMLRALVKEKFFCSCLVHQEESNNDENSFCINCCFSLCIHCMPYHQSHRILKVRRYMYNDVLRLKDAKKIFDCSLIQCYTTNSEKVVLLRPMRQRVSSEVKGSLFTCLVCNQNIKPSFGYCSMSCKLSNQTASRGGERDAESSSGGLGRRLFLSGSVSKCHVSVESSVEESSTNGERKSLRQEMSATTSSNGLTPTRKLRGRKCVPQRSPFF